MFVCAVPIGISHRGNITSTLLEFETSQDSLAFTYYIGLCS
jgi:hypothetical protein